MRRLLAVLGGTAAVVIPVSFPAATTGAVSARSSSADCADADLVPAADNLDRVEAAVLCLLNAERRSSGLVALSRSGRLDQSARFHSVAMVRMHFLGHEASGHPTLLARVRGYGYFNGAADGVYAENVGAGPASNGTARSVVDAWLASTAHRTNVLYAPFRDVGISAVLAPPDPAFFADYPSTVYTTDFGRRYAHRRCIPRRTAPVPGGSASPRQRYCRRRR